MCHACAILRLTCSGESPVAHLTLSAIQECPANAGNTDQSGGPGAARTWDPIIRSDAMSAEAPNSEYACLQGLPTDEADAGTRTPDPIITSDVLYQLSYVGVSRPRIAVDLEDRDDRRREPLPSARPGAASAAPSIAPSPPSSAGNDREAPHVLGPDQRTRRRHGRLAVAAHEPEPTADHDRVGIERVHERRDRRRRAPPSPRPPAPRAADRPAPLAHPARPRALRARRRPRRPRPPALRR